MPSPTTNRPRPPRLPPTSRRSCIGFRGPNTYSARGTQQRSRGAALLHALGEVLDDLRRGARLHRDRERLGDVVLLIDERDAVVARRDLERALRRLEAGALAVDEDLARRLRPDHEESLALGDRIGVGDPR